jgi:cytochrome c-type biogenesis protein CcmH
MGLLAIDALLKEDIAGAYGYWLRQLSSATPGSAQAREIQERMATIEPYLPAEQLAEIRGPTITFTVDITPELAAQVTDDMRLFVFARSPQPGGPPILANTIDLADFPISVSLDNNNSMIGTKVESVPQIIVGARLTRSGQPVAQPGDLQGFSEPFEPSDQIDPLAVVIDEVVAP